MNNILRHFEHFLEKKKINLFWTIYLNLRLLPRKLAFRFPILCYGSMRVRCAEGSIIIPPPIRKGMIQIGLDPTGYRTCGTTTISLFGGSVLEVGGELKIYQGASILVGRKAHLFLGDHVTVGDNAEIICMENIHVGTNTDITWNCQVTDFASHPMKDRATGEKHPMTKPIHLGQYCWIGNRSTLMPGTVLPDRIIVASNSLLNKNYVVRGVQPYSILGGMPAAVIKEGVERIYKNES